jgi:hypothetical protein
MGPLARLSTPAVPFFGVAARHRPHIDGERGPTDTDKLRELLFLQAGGARAAWADRSPKIKY